MTLLIAGHETTAAVLTWTFHCIADRPDVVARLQAEVDAVLGDRRPSMEDTRALRYTTRVINEAMRLYPQPPVLIRRAVEEDEVGGYTVEAGSDIFISIWNLHRSPALWDRPDEFDPDRFALDGPTPNEVTEEFRYLPFGGGKRKCIGAWRRGGDGAGVLAKGVDAPGSSSGTGAVCSRARQPVSRLRCCCS